MSSTSCTKKTHSTPKPTTSPPTLFLTGQAKSIGQSTGIVEVERPHGEGKVTSGKVLTIP